MNQKCIGLMAVLVLLLVLAPGAAHAQQGMPQVRADLVKGASLEGPTQVIVADLPQMSAQEAAQSAVEHPIFHGMSQAQYETLKAQAAVPGSTGKGSATLATPLQPMASEGAILTPLAST